MVTQKLVFQKTGLKGEQFIKLLLQFSYMSDDVSSGWRETLEELNALEGSYHTSYDTDESEPFIDADTRAEAEMVSNAENITAELQMAEKAPRHNDSYFTSKFSDFCKTLDYIREEEDIWVVYQEQDGDLVPLAYADGRQAIVREDLHPDIDVPEGFHPFSSLENQMTDFGEFLEYINGFSIGFPESLRKELAYTMDENPVLPDNQVPPKLKGNYVAPSISGFYESIR